MHEPFSRLYQFFYELDQNYCLPVMNLTAKCREDSDMIVIDKVYEYLSDI